MSTDPLWRNSDRDHDVRESFGNALSVPFPSPPLRRGHASGMDMVQVSDDPFGATPPSFPQPLSTASTGPEAASNPFDLIYMDTPRSTTHLAYPEDPTAASPGWARRAFPVLPVIRVQSASTDDYAEDRRSSYAESMVPLETPDDNFRNPFVDPTEYASSESGSSESVYLPHRSESTQSGTVLKDNSQAHTASRTNARMTMKSFRADIVPSPVDTIDRFWDLPTPGPYSNNRLSTSTHSPTSSESLLRSMSPGPGPTSRHS